jgi:acyl carrier protein
LLRGLCQDKLAALGPDTRLDEVTGLDSLRLVEAIALLEEHFQVVVDTDGLADLRTVGDLVRLILAARAG